MRTRVSVGGPLGRRFPYTRPVPKGEYLQYGGQAIIEGVMMRSKTQSASQSSSVSLLATWW